MTHGFLLAALLAPTPADAPPPVFPALAEPTLPAPPRQGDPWEPPPVPENAADPAAALPADAIDVARTLFAQGLADPRGCEYRQIAVVTGSVWGGVGAVDTRGWVLPSEDRNAPRFAVCWNGLVYPVLRVGPPADPAADVAAAEKVDAAARRAWFERHTPEQREIFHYRPFGLDADEGLKPAQPRGVPVCLLLRSGRGDLAARLHATFAPDGMKEDDDAAARRYVSWAGDWLWSLFDRTIKAHMRGDDRLTLIGCRELARVHPLTEAEADRRGYESNVYLVSDLPIEEQPIVGFLGQLSELTADAARRVAAGPAPATLSPKAPADLAEESIPVLVDRLEDVRATMWGQPGGIMWGADAVVSALTAKGEAAVPPLLDAWEHDDRLTRSVGFHRDFFRNRHVAPVRGVAAVIVGTILDARFESPAEARAYWAKHGDKPPAVRWYDILRDDAAGREKWLEAASNIVRPGDVTVTAGGWIGTPHRGGAEPPPPRGESLRDRKPTVLSLLALRAADICAEGEPGSDEMWAHQAACNLALIAFRWDRAAGPLLAEQYRRTALWLEEQRTSQYGWPCDDDLGARLAKLTIARIRSARAAGGETADAAVTAAVAEHVAFIRSYDEGELRDTSLTEPVNLFTPLWRFPDEPAARAAAEALFADPASRWVPLFQAPSPGRDLCELVDSPMLGVPAFREQMLARLADETVVATVAYRAEANYRDDDLNVPDWVRPLLWLETDDPAAPADGTEIAVRVCDLYAVPLSAAQGLPRFHWYWPRADRDAARKTMIDRLTRLGPRYAWSSAPFPGGWGSFRKEARLRLPVLDRPAEPADVAAGRAIFALGGERRIVPGLNLPREAEWTDEAKRVTRRYLGAGVSFGRADGYGVVWQAEEVREGDGWARYYGVVTGDDLLRVPAAELRLKEP